MFFLFETWFHGRALVLSLENILTYVNPNLTAIWEGKHTKLFSEMCTQNDDEDENIEKLNYKF